MSHPNRGESSSSAAAPVPNKNLGVEIRSVWAANLDYEMNVIASLIDSFPVVTMDTEFPGEVATIHNYQDPMAYYANVKENVDRLNLIQLGLTLSDEKGNLPKLGTDAFIWEFNFREFDLSRDQHSERSVELLKDQGIDFAKNRALGISSVEFAERVMKSGLVLNDEVTWVTFHGGYDFAYFVKILTQKPLPDELSGFLALVRVFFGSKVLFDVKHMMRGCDGLFGGLNKICQSLGVKRVVGLSHQAGSDSLLTMHAYMKMKEVYFGEDKPRRLESYANVVSNLPPLWKKKS